MENKRNILQVATTRRNTTKFTRGKQAHVETRMNTETHAHMAINRPSKPQPQPTFDPNYCCHTCMSMCTARSACSATTASANVAACATTNRSNWPAFDDDEDAADADGMEAAASGPLLEPPSAASPAFEPAL